LREFSLRSKKLCIEVHCPSCDGTEPVNEFWFSAAKVSRPVMRPSWMTRSTDSKKTMQRKKR
jgi:hypothetical protein